MVKRSAFVAWPGLCWTQGQEVWVPVNVLCSCAEHFTLTVPLSTQEYKWVPEISQVNNFNCCCYKLYELATYDDDFCPIYLSQLGLSFVNLEIFKNPDRGGVFYTNV